MEEVALLVTDGSGCLDSGESDIDEDPQFPLPNAESDEELERPDEDGPNSSHASLSSPTPWPVLPTSAMAPALSQGGADNSKTDSAPQPPTAG